MKRLRGLRLGHSWQSVRALSVPSHFSVLYAPIILMHVAVTILSAQRALMEGQGDVPLGSIFVWPQPQAMVGCDVSSSNNESRSCA